MPKPFDKIHWKGAYTVVLVANAIFIITFYILMKIFS